MHKLKARKATFSDLKDLSGWQVLYKKYLAFYKTGLTESQLATLWSWFFDIEKQMHGNIAVHENKIIGLVHFRWISGTLPFLQQLVLHGIGSRLAF